MAFVNREVEHPGRYVLVNVDTGETLGTFDLTRDEGTVINEGTALTADNLNTEITALATAIAQQQAESATATLRDSLPVIRRGTTALTVNKKSTGRVTLRYGTTFPGNPHVFVTPLTSMASVIRVTVRSRNTKSFTASVYNGSSRRYKVYFSWIAVY